MKAVFTCQTSVTMIACFIVKLVWASAQLMKLISAVQASQLEVKGKNVCNYGMLFWTRHAWNACDHELCISRHQVCKRAALDDPAIISEACSCKPSVTNHTSYSSILHTCRYCYIKLPQLCLARVQETLADYHLISPYCKYCTCMWQIDEVPLPHDLGSVIDSVWLAWEILLFP